MYKLMRIFIGGYQPNFGKLNSKKVIILRKPFLNFFSISNSNNGFGVIRGEVRKAGGLKAGALVCAFKRDDRQLLWEVKSSSDGTYVFKNIAKGLECFIIAFDPNSQYNAVIQDKVVAK